MQLTIGINGQYEVLTGKVNLEYIDDVVKYFGSIENFVDFRLSIQHSSAKSFYEICSLIYKGMQYEERLIQDAIEYKNMKKFNQLASETEYEENVRRGVL